MTHTRGPMSLADHLTFGTGLVLGAIALGLPWRMAAAGPGLAPVALLGYRLWAGWLVGACLVLACVAWLRLPPRPRAGPLLWSLAHGPTAFLGFVLVAIGVRLIQQPIPILLLLGAGALVGGAMRRPYHAAYY